MEIQYIRVGDYYILNLTMPEETRPIGKWGRMHREYMKECKPIQYNCLLLSGKLWTFLADLNEHEHQLYPRGGLLYPRPDAAGRNPPYWQMGTNAPGVSKGAQADSV